MTKRQHNDIIKKGKRLLLEYLNEEARYEKISKDTAKKLFEVMCDEYSRMMREDDDFYKEVKKLCVMHKHKSLHNPYIFAIAQKIVKEGNIKRMYYEKYPEGSSVERKNQ